MDKRGIQLSVNFLVVIIISITIFGFGVKFIYDISQNARDIVGMSQQQIDDKIDELACYRDEKTCLTKGTLELQGNRPKFVGLKILNVDNTKERFDIQVNPIKFIDVNNMEVAPLPSLTFLPKKKTLDIGTNEEEKIGIAFQVPKDSAPPKGTFVFRVKVDLEGDTYDTLTLNVRIV